MKTRPPVTKCVEMVGPDVQMDQHGRSYEPANRLLVACLHCSFPKMDVVPQPYMLNKGIDSPSEISPAQFGNFLVRKHVRDILQAVIPGACEFYSTINLKTRKPTDWLLAVPKQILQMPGRKPGKPVCPKCHEPKSGYIYTNPGTYLSQLKAFDSRGIDIFKSYEWDSVGIAEDDFDAVNRERRKAGEPPQSWREHIEWAIPDLPAPAHRSRWTRRHLGRNLFFSVRLEQLLKRVKVKGQLVRSFYFKEVQPSPEDELWIQENLRLLTPGSLSDKRSSGNARGCQQWFERFLKQTAARKPARFDFAAFEKKRGIKMPKTYKAFVSALGSKSFPHVGGLNGSMTTVLAPNKLDFKDYRRHKLASLIGEPTTIDGVLFATMDNGDGFVFDIASPRAGEYSVYWHRHEENELELFASNFAACIKRFADQS